MSRGRSTGGPGPAGPPISFRPLVAADLARVERWLAEPHVARWWPDGAEREFAPALAGQDPTRIFVIEVDSRPAGLIQVYRLADEPEYARAVGVSEAAGLDLFLGDPGLVGRGLGPVVITLFVSEVVWPGYPDVRRCIAGPSVANTRSQRAFEKAGFARLGVVTVDGEPEDEVIMVLDRPSAR